MLRRTLMLAALLTTRGFAADAPTSPFLVLPLADEASYRLLYRRGADATPKLATFDAKICRWPPEYHFDGEVPLDLPSQFEVTMADGFDYLDDDELFWLVDDKEFYKLPQRDELTPVRSGWKRLSVSRRVAQIPKKAGSQALLLRRRREPVYALIATWTGAPPPKAVADPTTWRKAPIDLPATELPTLKALVQPLKPSQVIQRVVSDDARAYYAKYEFGVDLQVDTVELRNAAGESFDTTATLDRKNDSVVLTDSSLAAAMGALGALRDGVPVRYRITAKVSGEPCRRLEADIYESPGGAKMGNLEVWTQPRSRRIQWNLKDRWAPIVTNDDTAPPIVTTADYVTVDYHFLNFIDERQGDWVSYVSPALPAKVWMKLGKDEDGLRAWSYTEPRDYIAGFPSFETTTAIKDSTGAAALPAKRTFRFVSQDATGAVVAPHGGKPIAIPWASFRDERGKPRFLPTSAR